MIPKSIALPWGGRALGWQALAAGAITAVVANALLRPALVGTMKAGIGLKNMTTEALESARKEAEDMYAEAASPTGSGTGNTSVGGENLAELVNELKALRADVAALKKQASDKWSEAR